MEDNILEKLKEIMMDFVGAYESFDKIPEARDEALGQIQALIEQQVLNGRIDELESIAETDDGALCLVGDDLGGVTIKDRLTTLKAQLKETPSYDE